MAINAKQNNNIRKTKMNGQGLVKPQSTKNVVQTYKSSKVEAGKFKSKLPLKMINENENDKDINIKLNFDEFEKTLDDNVIMLTSKDDSAMKQSAIENNSKETIMSSLGMTSTQPNTNASQFTLNSQRKPKSNSLNYENFLTNVTLGKIKIPTDEYREMFTKLIRTDYSSAILTSLLSDEEEIESFLSNHKITERMRCRMVDWMIEVLSNYHCNDSAYFEAINLMDRFFKACDTNHKYLQPNDLHLIGVACMFLGSKYQDIYPLRLKVIQEKIAHKKLSCEEIKQKEEEIAKTLNYSIGKPNLWDFIHIFLEEIFYVNANHHHITNKTLLERYYEEKGSERDEELGTMLNKLYTKNMLNLLNHVCVYLGKMNCHDYTLMQKKPSLLAASTIFVAVKICEQINKEEYINEYFTKKLNDVSQNSENEVIKTAQKILFNAQNFDNLFTGLENLKKVHFNAIIELKVTK